MNFDKKILKNANFGLLVVIVIGILIVVNFFSYQIFYRWDLTQNKDYSLASVSKKTVADLTDVVSIKAYFSTDLPAQFVNLRQEVGDILDEYVSYSGGKLKVEFIDPGNDQTTQRDLYMQGIPQLQFNALEKDKYQVVNGYLGLVIRFGDKTQVIPVIQDTNGLEYQITSAIKKVTSKQIAVVGFWQGNGTADTTKDITAAYKKLSDLYDVRTINFAADKAIPGEIETLIIVGPTASFNDTELKAIDAFLMRGGSLLVLVDGIKVGSNLTAEKNDVGLNKLLTAYGVTVNNDLVLDASNGMASFTQGFITFSTNYPFWPKVINQDFDQNNVATAKLESVVLPWASSLDIQADKLKGNQVSYLMKTTNRAWLEKDNFNLNPQADFSSLGQMGQFNLAIALSGKFSSAYNQTSTDSGRLIVVGDSDFIHDNFLNNNPDNLVLFQNLTDGLSLSEDLISIRSKGITDRPIRELSDTMKLTVRYLNIFGLTVVVILFGVIRYFLRRRRGFADEI